jgi:hypothetical protein
MELPSSKILKGRVSGRLTEVERERERERERETEITVIRIKDNSA